MDDNQPAQFGRGGGGYRRGGYRGRGRGGGGQYQDLDAQQQPQQQQDDGRPNIRYQQNNYQGGGGNRFTDGNNQGGGRFRGRGAGSNVWTRGGGAGGGDGGGGRGNRGRGRGENTWGRGAPREQPTTREDEKLPEDITLLTKLEAHSMTVSALAYEERTNLLYTGSKDGKVKSYSCVTGQMTHEVDVGGEVDCILLVEQFLFVGFHNEMEGTIKYWNTLNHTTHILTGHQGAIQAMIMAGMNLCTGGQDCSIRVWAYTAAADLFISSAVITAKSGGGHTKGVTCLATGGGHMVSGDTAGVMKVWDLITGTNIQTLDTAHTSAITRLMLYEGGGGRRNEARDTTGVLNMHGVSDSSGQPVLMVSYNNECCVRLFDLPTFKSRGVLPQVDTGRPMAAIQGSLLIVGDGQGAIHIFQWKPIETASQMPIST